MDLDTRNIPKQIEYLNRSFSKCPKAPQMNRQHTKKSCTQQNASFVKQIRLQDTIKTKHMGELTVVKGLLGVANSNMDVERKNLEACRGESGC